MRTESEVAAMQCPVCRAPLAMSERSGIEIDYCPQCRGVWLDRGELDKIIERSGPAEGAAPQAAAQAAPQPAPPLHQPSGGSGPWDMGGATHGGYGHGGYSHGGPPGDYRGGKPYYKKKKHWLSELFDD